MKIDKIIYDIREGVRQTVDDTEISDRYILHLININRSEQIRRLLNNLQRVTPVTVTQSFCIEMEEVSANSCGIFNGECDTILRSKEKLPNPLELHTKLAITSVRPASKLSKPLIFTSRERAFFTQHSPFKNTLTSYLDTDGYLYVIGKKITHKLIDCLTVTGIFEDPLELSKFKDCCNCETSTSCFDIETMDYPVPAHLVISIRETVIRQIIGSLQIPSDTINNSDEQ